ncbi:MAG: pyridoxamine 5'-phosphate oxidase family protein [Gammaproteobacteria bacterium]
MNLKPLRDLILGERWAALATLADAQPLASQVAYAVLPDFSGIVLHLSELAAHTRALMTHPYASLSVSEADDGRQDPQTLVRVSLSGAVRLLEPESEAYRDARQCYLARLPASEPLFEFADFRLFVLEPEKIRFVGGFGAARSFDGSALREVP